MKSAHFKFDSRYGEQIFVYKWLPDNYSREDIGIKQKNKPKAAINIFHGMGEHSERYDELAEVLTDAGFAVYASDQRGHGKTAGRIEKLGHYADNNGWFIVLDDLKMLTGIIEKENPGIDIFIFGHSAGSFLATECLILYPENIKGVILSGTACSPGLLGYVGILAAKLVIKKGGPAAKSPLHKKLTFEKYNNFFKPNRTTADWISRDENVVDKMLADPYCYQLFSAAFYSDLARALLRINDKKNINKIPKNMPVFIMSGTECAVGDFKKGVTKVYNSFLKAGMRDVDFKLYKDARHELINELNKSEVFEDITAWLNKKQGV
jgi:alpha-beta hydrolase superfamily lysophospholipase